MSHVLAIAYRTSLRGICRKREREVEVDVDVERERECVCMCVSVQDKQRDIGRVSI